MKILRNNKGFSLIEILAVVVILGVVSTIGIVSVTRLIDSSKKHYYESQQSQLVLAARAYAGDHKEVLPRNVGEKKKVYLKKLYETNYLKDKIVDKNKIECYPIDKSNADGTLKEKGSYVNIIKTSESEYSYKGYLYCKSCGQDGNCEEEMNIEEENKPTINIDMPNNKNNDLFNPETTIDITYNAKGIGAKVASYSYKIYVDKVLKLDSGTKINGKREIINVHEPVYKYLPGNVKVVATITNSEGEVKTVTNNKDYSDSVYPACGMVKYDMKNEMTTYKSENTNNKTCGTQDYLWTNDVRHAWVVCDDKLGLGCAQTEFSKYLDSEGVTDTISIRDNNPNNPTYSCKVMKCIDRTTPKITVKLYKSKSNGDKDGGAFKTFTVDSQKSIKTYKADEKYDKWINGVDNKNGIIVEVSLTDVDKITGVKSEIESMSWYQNAKNQKENAIGATNLKVDENKKITTKTYIKEQRITDDGVRKQVIKVKDKAGNETTYNLTLKIDFTPPPKPDVYMYLVNSTTAKTKDKTYPNDKWKNKYVWANTSHPKDDPDVSGWRTNQYTTTGKHGEYNNKDGNEQHINAEGVSTIYFRSIDHAGNYSEKTATKTIKLDRKNPECSIKKTNTYSTSGVTLTTTCEDKANKGVGNKSGVVSCANTEVSARDKYVDTKNNIKASQTYTVKDDAGNSSTCDKTVHDTQKRTNSWNSCKTGEPSTCKGGTVSKTCNGYKERGANNSGSSCGPKSSCGLGSACVSCQYDCSYYDSCKTGHPSTCQGGWDGWTDWKDVNSCKASTSKPTKVECRTIYY